MAESGQVNWFRDSWHQVKLIRNYHKMTGKSFMNHLDSQIRLMKKILKPTTFSRLNENLSKKVAIHVPNNYTTKWHKFK